MQLCVSILDCILDVNVLKRSPEINSELKVRAPSVFLLSCLFILVWKIKCVGAARYVA